jgi:hypothetical protein
MMEAASISETFCKLLPDYTTQNPSGLSPSNISLCSILQWCIASNKLHFIMGKYTLRLVIEMAAVGVIKR